MTNLCSHITGLAVAVLLSIFATLAQVAAIKILTHQRRIMGFWGSYRSGAVAISGLLVAAAAYPVTSYAYVIQNETSQTYAKNLGTTNYPSGGLSSAGTATYSTAEGLATATTSYGSAMTSPQVSASAVSYQFGWYGFAQLDYSFEVLGSGGSTKIDVTAFANAINSSPAATTFGTAEAAFNMFQASTNNNVVSGEVLNSCGFFNGCSVPSPAYYLIVNAPETVQENTPYEVSIVASADALGGVQTANGAVPSTLSAIVDPTIVLDPGDASGLSLVFSQGINERGYVPPPPMSSVPEPRTYAMLLAGLGLIGFIAYRRKNNAPNLNMAA